MKNLNMLVWITQLGVSVAVPLAGFTLLGLWLRSRFGLGVWVLLLCLALGFISAINGLRYNLKAMEKLDRQNSKKSDDTPPPISFNEHD